VAPFQDYQLKLAQALSIEMLETDSPTSVCLLGSSHARKMYEYLDAEGISNLTNLRLYYHDVHLPGQVEVGLIQRLIRQKNCTKFVVSVGQWPPGKRFRIHQGKGPTSFRDFYEQMARVLGHIHKVLPHVQVYARSINYNPLKALIGKCAPNDWRSPLIIDGYNAVLQHAVQELGSDNISYVDTNFTCMGCRQ